jgi:D-glycero-alpha-D-manno-heptose 1-phosphate guanylyltransferase
VPLEDSQALILCGGFGKRLRPAVPELPKCLAPVGDRPFLEYVLVQLRGAGIRNVTLCVGYRSEEVAEYFERGDRWEMSLSYSFEKRPLGTAGALKKAESLVCTDPFLVLNGDSILDMDLGKMVEFHKQRAALATIALATVASPERYGSVRTDESGLVTAFNEKQPHARTSVALLEATARINGGAYVFDRAIFGEIPAGTAPVSLETDVFPRLTSGRLFGFPSDGYFVDIGVPEDYARAQRELPRRFFPC